MPKIPGVTSEILKKKVLEALEGIGIKASDIMGRGTNIQRITSGKDINPFKPNMLEAMRSQNKTMGDALDAFANEAKFIMNANDAETVNFLNNLNTYKSIGGGGVDTQGVGSMMKAMTDLEDAAKNLKTSTDEAKTFAEKELEKALLTAGHGGDPFKVPDNKSFGGSMYAEGNMRTALREFLQTEFKNGRLKLNDLDKERVLKYSPMIEHDPILVFQRLYGDDAIKNVEDIVTVFEKGESYKHYEQLLRENVDDQFLKPLNQADVGDGRYVLTEAEEIKPKLPDDDDIPFNQGGRVGLKYGSKDATKNLVHKIKDWANKNLSEKKGLESMFKKVRDLDDEGKIFEKEILDDFITTADEMSGAKINENRILANKRSLAYQIDEWNKRPKKTYYRGDKSEGHLGEFKDDPEWKKTHDQLIKDQTDAGWGKYMKESTFDEDLKGGFFSPDKDIARAYASTSGIPKIKKIELEPWEVQEGLERNFEKNPFVGPGDILLDKSTRQKATTDWWETLKKKLEMFGLAEGGRVGMWKGSGKKGIQSLIKKVDDKFGEGTLKKAADIDRPETAVEDEATRKLFEDFNMKLDTQDLMTAAEAKVMGPIATPTKNKHFLDPESTDHTTWLLQEKFFRPDAVDYLGKKVPSNWIALERAKAKDTLKKLGPLPSRRHPNWEDMRQIRQGVKNRLVALDITEELGGNVAMFDFLRIQRGMPDQFLDINNYIRKADSPIVKDELSGIKKEISQLKDLGLPQSAERYQLQMEFPGITDDLINNILADKNPQRIAEVKATMREALKMQEKGMGPEEIIQTFQKTPRTKNAAGGGVGSMFRGV